jgi:hypothetical protein
MRALHKKGGSPLLHGLPPSDIAMLAVEAALLATLARLVLAALLLAALLTGLILSALLLLAGLVLPALLRILLVALRIVLFVRHRDVLRHVGGCSELGITLEAGVSSAFKCFNCGEPCKFQRKSPQFPAKWQLIGSFRPQSLVLHTGL